MSGIAYKNFSVGITGSVSQKLLTFVQAQVGEHSIGTLEGMRSIISLYYGSHVACAVQRKLRISFRLAWNDSTHYNFFINDKAWNLLDENDCHLLDNFLGLQTSYTFQKYEANIQHGLKRFNEAFSQAFHINGNLTKKNLRNLRIWALEHDFKLDAPTIESIYGFKRGFLRPRQMAEVELILQKPRKWVKA